MRQANLRAATGGGGEQPWRLVEDKAPEQRGKSTLGTMRKHQQLWAASRSAPCTKKIPAVLHFLGPPAEARPSSRSTGLTTRGTPATVMGQESRNCWELQQVRWQAARLQHNTTNGICSNRCHQPKLTRQW